jgi:hypothetical protein
MSAEPTVQARQVFIPRLARLTQFMLHQRAALSKSNGWRSPRRSKPRHFGILIPSTNTTCEIELCRLAPEFSGGNARIALALASRMMGHWSARTSKASSAREPGSPRS